MTITEAKGKTTMLSELLKTTSHIVKPYCIYKEQIEKLEDCIIEMLAIADSEISYAINITRIQKGLKWDEYNTNQKVIENNSEINDSAICIEQERSGYGDQYSQKGHGNKGRGC